MMIYHQYTVCDMCGKKYRRKMDMLQHKKDDHMFITKEEVAALERLKVEFDLCFFDSKEYKLFELVWQFLYDKKGNSQASLPAPGGVVDSLNTVSIY